MIPAAAASLLDQMGIPPQERSFAAMEEGSWFERLGGSGFVLKLPKPIFPRLDLPGGA